LWIELLLSVWIFGERLAGHVLLLLIVALEAPTEDERPLVLFATGVEAAVLGETCVCWERNFNILHCNPPDLEQGGSLSDTESRIIVSSLPPAIEQV
jgi:hypothetical protein